MPFFYDFMNKPTLHFSIVLFLGLLFSCDQEVSRKELKEAESLMLSHPDSALHMLESIPSPEKMSRVDYAAYCLLLTEAQDKTYYTFTSDSVIRVAAEYFLDKGDNHVKARVYYIWGRVHHALLHYLKAHECYLQAIPFAQKENNYPLLLRIHNQCGNLYRNRKLYDKALSSLHEALRYCQLADDQKNLPYCLRDIGRVYLFKGEMDSTFHYYQEALNIVRKNELRTAESVIYRELERYGGRLIHEAESIFTIDSDLVLSVLKKNNDNDRWLVAMKIVYNYILLFSFDNEKSRDLLSEISLSYKYEFNFNGPYLRQISSLYRNKRYLIDSVLNDSCDVDVFTSIISKKFAELVPIIYKVNSKANNVFFLSRLLKDCIHMRVNRIFISENRLHEMILTDFLCRYYSSIISKKKYINMGLCW